MLTGGLLPFPRTGGVPYAKPILSYGSEIPKAAGVKGWEHLLGVGTGGLNLGVAHSVY
jgi:hypothetical protein